MRRKLLLGALLLVGVRSTLIEPFALEEVGQEIRNLHIIQIGEGEVRIAVNSDLGKMQQGSVSPMSIDRIDELLCKDEAKPPLISYGRRIGRRWHVVAHDHLDWDLG